MFWFYSSFLIFQLFIFSHSIFSLIFVSVFLFFSPYLPTVPTTYSIFFNHSKCSPAPYFKQENVTANSATFCFYFIFVIFLSFFFFARFNFPKSNSHSLYCKIIIVRKEKVMNKGTILICYIYITFHH